MLGRLRLQADDDDRIDERSEADLIWSPDWRPDLFPASEEA